MSAAAPRTGYGPCPNWCPGDHHAGAAHSAQLGRVELQDEEFTWSDGTACVVLLAVDHDGRPAVEFSDGRSTLTYRFSLPEAEQIIEAMTRAVAAGRAADPVAVCRDCDAEFDVDSSPHLDRCWVHAEQFDLEHSTAQDDESTTTPPPQRLQPVADTEAQSTEQQPTKMRTHPCIQISRAPSAAGPATDGDR